MNVVDPGHVYDLSVMDGAVGEVARLQFVSRRPLHEPRAGVLNQEVIRALIDRVKHLDSEVPWEGNTKILHHLRMALVLHEARAMIRDVEKCTVRPEEIRIGADGHFALSSDGDEPE